MTFLLTLLAAIFVLGPLIALHEWGHYIVARICGVKVLTYSIGFGPKIFGWTSKKSGIDYRISALPLGGYVKMLDEREGEVAEVNLPGSAGPDATFLRTTFFAARIRRCG